MKEDTETHLTGFAQPTAVSYATAIARDYSFIRFERDVGFKAALTNPLKIVDGRTVGQAERDYLHEKLDFWIEENLK